MNPSNEADAFVEALVAEDRGFWTSIFGQTIHATKDGYVEVFGSTSESLDDQVKAIERSRSRRRFPRVPIRRTHSDGWAC